MILLILRILGSLLVIGLGFLGVARVLCYIADLWRRRRWDRESNRLARAYREEQIRQSRPRVIFEVTEAGEPPTDER